MSSRVNVWVELTMVSPKFVESQVKILMRR
jgi:hypothetical protein